jgi:proteasome accessory factor C
MPKSELDNEGLFNLALAIVGLVFKEGSHKVRELASHFEVSERIITKAVKTLVESEDLRRYETHFYVDEDALEDGEVSISLGLGALDTPPVLSKRQLSAIAAGLDYLASLPQFEENQDLLELRTHFGGSITLTREPQQQLMSQLGELRKAIENKLQVELEYQNQLGERSSRRVDPLRLDFVGQRYYLRGYCHKNLDLRAFRVDRVIGLEITATKISEAAAKSLIPEDVYGQGADQHLVTLSAEPVASEIFWNFPIDQEPTLVAGRYVGQIRVGSLAALGRHIARYGGSVVVTAPNEARGAVLEYARVALKRLGE